MILDHEKTEYPHYEVIKKHQCHNCQCICETIASETMHPVFIKRAYYESSIVLLCDNCFKKWFYKLPQEDE